MLETIQNTYFLSLIKILKAAGEKQPDSRRKRPQMTSLEKSAVFFDLRQRKLTYTI